MNKRSRSRRPQAAPDGVFDIFRRFFSENMLQTSAALAFTTLLAVVPLLTVVLSIVSAIPFLDVFVGRLDVLIRDNLLPTSVAGAIAGGIGRFTHKAQQLTEAGLAMLGVTAFFLMLTIERAFNHLWRARRRPLWARFRLYIVAVAIGPVSLGMVAVVISFAVSVSLGLFDEPAWLRQGLLKAVSMFLMALFFSLVYYFVPNAEVPRRAAVVGGVFAALAFSAMQKLFELYLASSVMLTSIYGAFSAIPVFLVWLDFSWAVVLFGGLIVATLSARVKR